jgi:uncharacterized protein YlxP (DUF503 family)
VTTVHELTDQQLIALCNGHLKDHQPLPHAVLKELLTRFEVSVAILDQASEHRRKQIMRPLTTKPS